ncbi:PREDICTED: PWWP domain-containing protein 2A-like [Nicrophorus vespilloides]|uniref:PWWP domain-containing protein 2A-like n=1 Tax=Nicrophorus vespilloides TaxID=110193 RepID=A0ABM1N959_NICVS|nr:PREDICTED: PWWP domain-containing protein 2A-like [Nicrophorus vespilloides]
MADSDDIHLLKQTRISVLVDEALPDILVVTYEFGLKIFKGVLLDSTKKNLPCGVAGLNPAFSVPSKAPATATAAEDPLYSVNQRYAYTDPANVVKKKNVISSKYKNNKMTVRLRPRQVLCSKCKGICNENSENVTRKRKSTETILSPPIKRSANAPITRSVNTVLSKSKKAPEMKRTLIPKAPQEQIPTALSGNVNKINIDNNKKPLVTVSNLPQTCDNVKSNVDNMSHSPLENADANDVVQQLAEFRRNLRNKKRCDEHNNQPEQQTTPRTIKICYGPQGEGTVLKIPAQIENLNVEDDLGENVNVEEKETNKAARKAMKKAKKEAKKKVIVSSPDLSASRYGGSSPRYTVGSASPRHGLGNHSPRYVTATASEPTTPKKRKRKLKHKKKHREDKDRKSSNKDGDEEPSKEPCLTQKLSINLKRLSTSYTSCSNDKTDDCSSDESEQVPDFPETNPSVLLRLPSSPAIGNASGIDGCRMTVGEVVWGKLPGFPWWPARILTLSSCEGGDCQAHISWFGSTTSSLLQCNQLCLYLDNFKVYYDKKKRGPYKEAIKQATDEARQRVDQSIVVSPARSIVAVVPPALASPREINVTS